MELVTPSFGLFFWTVLIFLTFFFLVKKFAWGPILTALKEREKGIEDALSQAQKARTEMLQLTSQNEQLLLEARNERAEILAEANRMKDRILAEAKEQAAKEYARKVQDAEQAVTNAKMAALTEIKNIAGTLALDIAQKLVQKELSKDGEHQKLIQQSINDLKLN